MYKCLTHCKSGKFCRQKSFLALATLIRIKTTNYFQLALQMQKCIVPSKNFQLG